MAVDEACNTVHHHHLIIIYPLTVRVAGAPLMISQPVSSTFPCSPLTTSGLVIEVFNDSHTIGADVILLHGCPQSCMPNPVEGLLEVYKDMVEVLLVLEIFLAALWCSFLL